MTHHEGIQRGGPSEEENTRLGISKLWREGMRGPETRWSCQRADCSA